MQQEVARLEAELREAREVPPRASGAGEGGEVVYASALSFPLGSAELAGEFQSRADQEMRELLPAVAGLPEAAGWRLQVDSYSGQAASEAGIAIDAWELALLRVASVTEYLIQAGSRRTGSPYASWPASPGTRAWPAAAATSSGS